MSPSSESCPHRTSHEPVGYVCASCRMRALEAEVDRAMGKGPKVPLDQLLPTQSKKSRLAEQRTMKASRELFEAFKEIMTSNKLTTSEALWILQEETRAILGSCLRVERGEA